MALKLTTIAKIKKYLKITSEDSDALLETLINYASQQIQTYIDRNLDGTITNTEYYDGTGTYILFLTKCPIITIISIDLWDTYLNQSSQSYTVNTDYLLYSDEGYIYMRGGWIQGRKNYKIVYTAGYLTQEAVPDDLELACNILVANMFANSGNAGIKNESIGNYSVNYLSSEQGIPENVKALLSSYRKYL